MGNGARRLQQQHQRPTYAQIQVRKRTLFVGRTCSSHLRITVVVRGVPSTTERLAKEISRTQPCKTFYPHRNFRKTGLGWAPGRSEERRVGRECGAGRVGDPK